MHGLRFGRPTHRDVRSGILTALLLAACLLAACSGRTGASAGGASAAASGTTAWFQLQSGVFHSVADPRSAVQVMRRPWTIQDRIADMAFLDGSLCLAINGSGLAVAARDETGTVSFAYHADSLIFAHRTVTTLVPRQGTLAIHLYYNALLNDALPQELALSGVSLVSYLPATGEYTFIIPPFQKKNPDWEAAGFAPESENSFDFEWKFTDASETRFAYTRFHADTKAEETVDRDTYAAALGVPAITGPSVPSTLEAFFSACSVALSLPSAETALQFSLRSRESPIRRNYRSRKESDSSVAIPVFDEGGVLYALLPHGSILCSRSGTVTTIPLPALPEGFRYADVMKWGDALVLPWEETSFTEVGRAGLLVYTPPQR